METNISQENESHSLVATVPERSLPQGNGEPSRRFNKEILSEICFVLFFVCLFFKIESCSVTKAGVQ